MASVADLGETVKNTGGEWARGRPGAAGSLGEGVSWAERGLTWLTLLSLWQQELCRRLEVVAGDEHQLLQLEKLLDVLAERGRDRNTE